MPRRARPHAKRLAVPALVGTFPWCWVNLDARCDSDVWCLGCGALVSTGMLAAPDIGVEATHVGTFTAVAFGSGLVAD